MICGVNIGGKDTLEEWGLMLCNDLSIGAAVPRYRFIEIPEMSGALDLTEALTGSVPYDQRTITFTLFAVHDVIAGTRTPATEEHFQTVLARFSGFANGKRLHLYLPDNPDHYFVGRVSVGGKSGYNSGRVKVEVLADPYRLKDGETTLTVDDDDFFKTATPGALVTFDDGGENLPMTSAEVSLSPQQDLNGYDHPWPAGGGTNKYDDAAKTGGLIDANGNVATITTWWLSDYCPIPVGTTAITLSWESESAFYQARIVAYDSSKSLLSGSYVAYSGSDVYSHTFTIPNTAAFVRVNFSHVINGNERPRENVRVNVGSADLGFAPYSNICPISGHTGAELNIAAEYDAEDKTTYSVTFTDQGTVYGGAYDFVSGKLRVMWASVDLGTLSWSSDTSVPRFFTSGISADVVRPNQYVVTSAKCSHYKSGSMSGKEGLYSPTTDKLFAVSEGGNVSVKDTSKAMSAADFKTAMSGVQLVYELATPIEIDLTPTEVETLLGVNNVWSDDGDISELIYMFTNEIIINNEGMPAVPTINASEAGPMVTLREASHVLAAGDNRFSDFVLQSGENVMRVEDPAGTLTIKYQEGML